MAPSKQIPIIVAGDGFVPFPGVSSAIPLTDRADIIAQLVPLIQAEQDNRTTDGLIIGVVPVLAQPAGSERSLPKPRSKRELTRVGRTGRHPTEAGLDDLSRYGTTVKIHAFRVDGSNSSSTQMLVEGISRFKVDRFFDRDAHLSAEVSMLTDVFSLPDQSLESIFNELRLATRKLVMFARMTGSLPKNQPVSDQLGRQIDGFISKVPVGHAGLLADFVLNLLNSSHQEKLDHLADLEVVSRLDRAHRLVLQEIQRYQKSIQARNSVSGSSMIVHPSSSRPLADLLNAVRPRQGKQLPSLGGMSGMGGGGEESNELDELKQRLDDAGLPAEAAKVVRNELQRLYKMSPSQTEYHVCRNYLETMAEIPWSKATTDTLDRNTLAKAQAQLDHDHAGLDHVKRRLIEYLAVLRLKQDVHAQLDSSIRSMQDRIDAAEQKDEVSSVKTEPDGETAPERPAEKASADEVSELKAQIVTLKSRKSGGKAPILLLVGPPGTGKTSLAKSIAAALGRSFHRLSLGGVRDEAEIRGHRRTYVAAMPGVIVRALKTVGVSNPVLLLDEIDKLAASNYHGDPAAALLEVLDPEQNNAFSDHYLGVPIDLSSVLFIATANSLDTIPGPLLDRMETISLSGYTSLEKRDIAHRHLLPKQIIANGLAPDQLEVEDGVVDKIITGYTREAGVRALERTLGAVCRAKAVEYARFLDTVPEKAASPDSNGVAPPATEVTTDGNVASASEASSSCVPYCPVVRLADLEPILGLERFGDELAAKSARPGVVTGLVAYSSGAQGGILFIEVADMAGSGDITLTGTLGDVLKESVTVALSWVRAHAFALGIVTEPETDLMRARTIHVHCPAGAVPKDGPSAGLAHTVALVSLFSARPVDPTTAMTGEVSLRGRVLPVGGIREKLIGALRAGVRTVVLPADNRKDVADLPDEVRSGLRIVHVSHVWEALQLVWPDGEWKGWAESRL